MAALNILAINSGSSSLKASYFPHNAARQDFHYAHIGAHDDSTLASHYAQAFDALLLALTQAQPDAIVFRFVHGGDITEPARMLDASERTRLQQLTSLAPLHMPYNLLGVELCAARFHVPMIACFDTAFHHTLPEMAYRLPIPNSLHLRKYGFHGINYAYVAQQLPKLLGSAANGHVVVAHLGHGASLCCLKNLQSIDTTMGYTAAGGIPMATRSGDLDPGIMLALAQRYDHQALLEMVYQHMGLLALSDGESADMAALVNSDSPQARFAVDYFAQQVRAVIGGYAAKYGGIDALVFTGGIGEHSALIRKKICEPLQCLQFALNDEANQTHATVLNTASSKPILQIHADEEVEMARLATALMLKQAHSPATYSLS
ncbi:MAG TPA: acetate kinase [Methylophilus sp.]